MIESKRIANELAVSRGCQKLPTSAYSEHKSGAKRRGIPFDLSFDQWWAIWEEKYHLRGRNKMSYVMCRNLDSGGYSLGNVKIDLACTNLHEKKINRVIRFGGRIRVKQRVIVDTGDDLA